MEAEDEFINGEDIFDVSSWTTDLGAKKFLMQKHLKDIGFPKNVTKLLEFVESYCESIFGGEFEIVTELNLTNKDIMFDFVDGFVFEPADSPDFTAMEELKLLHSIVLYFHSQKMDIVKCAVFDCLFGDVWEGQCHNKQSKFDLLCKLVSMAVGTKTPVILNCAGVWLQRHGCSNREAKNLVSALVSDYCQLIPNTSHMLKDVIDISPTFVSRFTSTLTDLYHFGSRKDEKEFVVPPKVVVDILSEWLINCPEFCLTTIPDSFLLMPTIYNTADDDLERIRDTESNKPYLGLIKWTTLFPIYFEQVVPINATTLKLTCDNDIANAPTTLLEANVLKLSFAKLHYGLLQFINCQNKINNAMHGVSDNLEPGEVSDDNETHELISQRDLQLLMYCIVNYIESLQGEGKKNDGINAAVEHFSRVIQISKHSKSISLSYDALRKMCIDLPKSRLLSLVLTK